MAEDDENVALQIIEARVTRVTVTRYMRKAQRLIAAVNRLAAEIPDLEGGGPGERAFVRSKAGVPKAFVDEALGRLQINRRLKTLMAQEGDAALATKQYVDAFQPLRKALGAVYTTLTWTLQYKEAQLASYAQKIFGYAKAVAQDSTDVNVKESAQQLRRARRRPRKKRKPKPETE